MNASRPVIGLALASLLLGCGGEAEYRPPELPPPPPPAPVVEPEALPEPYSQASPPVAPPSDAPPPPSALSATAPSATSAAQLPMPGTQAPRPAPPPIEPAPPVYSYPTGQWVYTVDHEWIWVPAGSSTVDMDGMPYVYLYTPSFGWTWYVSPWGWGPYHYGIWVGHPWHLAGWHGYWVAHPRVIVRLGRGHYHRR